MPVDKEQIDNAFRGAIRLASAQGEVQWIRWVLSTVQKLSRAPSPAIVEQIAQVPPIVLDAATQQIEDALESFRKRWDSLGAEDKQTLGALAEVRDRLRAQRQRSTPDAGSS